MASDCGEGDPRLTWDLEGGTVAFKGWGEIALSD